MNATLIGTSRNEAMRMPPERWSASSAQRRSSAARVMRGMIAVMTETATMPCAIIIIR